MPYRCHQNVSPPYTSKPCTSGSSTPINNVSRFRKAEVSPSPPRHQEQHGKLIPRSFSRSQVSSTPLPLYPSAITTSNMATDAYFGHTDHDDMQPLDLSMRARRQEEHTVKHSTAGECKPICMVKSCICGTQPEHLSPHSITGQAVTLSPLPGMTLSSFIRADSPVYTQQQVPSSAYHVSCSKATPPPSSVPQRSPWTSTQASPFQLLIATDKVLNGAHNSSGLYRPYDDHLHQDMNASTCEEAEQESTALSKQNYDDDDDENDEPTYMDLDSTTTIPSSAKAKKNYTANSGFVYGRPNSLHTSSVHNRSTEGKMEAVRSQHQSPLLQALNSKKGHDFSDKRAAAYFLGGVISHTSFENSRKKIIGHTSIIPNSEQPAHPKNPHQQQHLPDSSTSPASLPVPTGRVNVYRSQTDAYPTTTGHYQDNHGHTGMLHNDYPVYSQTSVSNQHLPSSTNQMHLAQSVRKSPVDHESHAGRDTSKSTSHKTTSNIQLPVSTTTTSEGLIGNKHKRPADCSDDSLQQVASEKEENSSTKISLLDFWISKILMERSIEASQPKKPCNVDYICTANGEKRIRLRLVDLMEMQVEQSMKA